MNTYQESTYSSAAFTCLEIYFHFSKPEERSQEFIDFVKLCLDKNPSQRATATELLQHNFITQNNTARGREILLEVIHQAQEIKKRKKAKNQQTNRKNSDSRHENGPFFSKKSSDSDSGKILKALNP